MATVTRLQNGEGVRGRNSALLFAALLLAMTFLVFPVASASGARW